MPIQEFPIAVIERLGYYVYALIEPQTSQVFYIGKGIGNRVFSHAYAAITDSTPNDKLDTIRAVLTNGFEVNYSIIRHGLTEEEALEVEAALIDYAGITTLTNQVLGHNSDDRGRMSPADIIEKYAAPEATIEEPAILVTINRRYRRGMEEAALYEITRGNWVIGTRRERAKYAFAVSNGIIRQVYEISHWFPAPVENPELKTQKRWCFEGKIADHLHHYIGSSTARYTTLGAQNPIRYVNC